jgi:hypothetical protein
MRFLSVREVCEKIGLGRDYDTHSGMLETIPGFPLAIVFDEGCDPAEPPEVHRVFDEQEIEQWMQLQKDKRDLHTMMQQKPFFTRIKAESAN